MGAVLCFEPFEGADDISGILYINGDSKIMGINSAHSHTRQRFSIAYEIGHTVPLPELLAEKKAAWCGRWKLWGSSLSR